MSRCECLECSYRRRHLDDKLDQADMRLVLAMTALSRVMYWVGLILSWGDLEACTMSRVGYAVRSGYFRLVYA